MPKPMIPPEYRTLFADELEKVPDRDKLKTALSWIRRHLSPEQVFPDDRLEKWAEEYGYGPGDN